MCLIVFAWQAHPDYPLVVAANRDEYLARPAAPAHWWVDAPELLAGRDLEAGGTWMGLTRGGRFAALTNYRDPSRHIAGAPSRAALVREAVEDVRPAPATLQAVQASAGNYAAFNLLVGKVMLRWLPVTEQEMRFVLRGTNPEIRTPVSTNTIFDLSSSTICHSGHMICPLNRKSPISADIQHSESSPGINAGCSVTAKYLCSLSIRKVMLSIAAHIPSGRFTDFWTIAYSMVLCFTYSPWQLQCLLSIPRSAKLRVAAPATMK